MGLNIEDVGANEMNGLKIFAPHGAVVQEADLRMANKIWQHVSWPIVCSDCIGLIKLAEMVTSTQSTSAHCIEGKGHL